MSGAIAVFVKTPDLSPVKTRLGKTIGQQQAEQFHLLASQAVAEAVQAASQHIEVQGYFAVAEQSALHHDYWQCLPTVWQREGGLGERMGFIYQQLLQQHDYVMLVGADIPQMTTEQLIQAAECLYDDQATFSFAPSEDGGFWLFGGNAELPIHLWTEVVYSQTTTGADFLKAIQAVGKVHHFDCLRDVDTVADLLPLQHVLRQLTHPLATQTALINFLAGVVETG